MLSTAVRRLVNLYAVAARGARRRVHRQRRRRRGGRRPRRAGVDVAHVVDARRGGDVVRAKGGSAPRSRRAGRRATDRVRPAGHRRRLDGADLAAEHGRRPAGLRPAGGPVRPRRPPARQRPRRRRDRRRRQPRRAASPTPKRSGRRRPPARARRRSTGLPTARAPPSRRAEHPELFRVQHPRDRRLLRGRLVQGPRGRGPGGLRLRRAGQAVHDRHHGLRPGQARDGQRRGHPGRGDRAAPSTRPAPRSGGRPTPRSPWAPWPGGSFEPVRYSPMQPWHERHGADPLVAGPGSGPTTTATRPPRSATSASASASSTSPRSGKLDLRGPDVPKLLNLALRQQVVEAGRGRGPLRRHVRRGRRRLRRRRHRPARARPLPDVHHLLGRGAVWEWVENWLQTDHPDWRVHVTPVTTAYASINVAGPKLPRAARAPRRGRRPRRPRPSPT